MKEKDPRIILEEKQSDFLFKENKSKLDISFNRI